MNIILFGPPGSGKGTQSSFLVKRLGMTHISTGDLFRSAIKDKTDLGVEVKKYLDKGELVPDSITVDLVNKTIIEMKNQSFVLDGFPRTITQAITLEQLLAKSKIVINKAIFLNVPHSDLISRLTGRRVCTSCGTVFHIETKPTKCAGICDFCGSNIVQRNDDKIDVINARLKVYDDTSSQLKEFYAIRNLIVEVSGVGNSEEIFKNLKQHLT